MDFIREKEKDDTQLAHLDGGVNNVTQYSDVLEENAIGEANLPSVTVAREKRGRYRAKNDGPPQPKPAILQPSLFD